MTMVTLLDDATRPTAPDIAGVTPRQRAQGRRLAAIHRMHLQELDRTRLLMERIEAGEELLAAMADAIPRLQMVQAYQAFGALCGQECRMLTFHHSAEDAHIFPALQARADDGLRRVIDRLAQEHLVIHALIDQLRDAAARALAAPDGDSFADLKRAFAALEAVVRSHFGYEETQLEQALGFFDIPL